MRRWTIIKSWGLGETQHANARVDGPSVSEPVEVMPVPDDAAMLEAAEVIARTYGQGSLSRSERIIRAVLAALEDQ